MNLEIEARALPSISFDRSAAPVAVDLDGAAAPSRTALTRQPECSGSRGGRQGGGPVVGLTVAVEVPHEPHSASVAGEVLPGIDASISVAVPLEASDASLCVVERNDRLSGAIDIDERARAESHTSSCWARLRDPPIDARLVADRRGRTVDLQRSIAVAHVGDDQDHTDRGSNERLPRSEEAHHDTQSTGVAGGVPLRPPARAATTRRARRLASGSRRTPSRGARTVGSSRGRRVPGRGAGCAT